MGDYWDIFRSTFLAPFATEEETGEDLETGDRLVFPDEARERQSIAFGGTGSGKTRFIQALALGDVYRQLNGFSERGWAMIDNQGDSFNEMRARLALGNLTLLEHGHPGLAGHVVIIDTTNEEWSIKYSPLELKMGDIAVRKADRLAHMVTELFSDDPLITVQLYEVLYRGFWTLMLAGLPITQMPRFLREKKYRDDIVLSLNNPELSGYWKYDFPNTPREIREYTGSTRRRLDRLVHDPGIKSILEGPSTTDFRELVDNGAFVLVNAPQSDLGEGASNIFCAFIVAEFFHAVMTRKDTPERTKRRPFTLYADEFQNYLRITIERIVRESRKLGFELFLATQEVRGGAADEDLMRMVRNVIQNIFAFNQSRDGAELLHKTILSPKLYATKATNRRYHPEPTLFGNVLVEHDEREYKTLDELWEEAIRELTELPDRMLYWKRRGHKPVRATTKDVPDIEQLDNYHRLDVALRIFDETVYKNGGRKKFKQLPSSSTMSEEDSIWTK